MGILTTQDKEKIKRTVPKASNKIIDATVARLYIAYPDPTKWVYTGLVGAIALVDDLVGHTFFLKLIDITGHRGVLWDQELYVNFEYNQDRKFFHTFEIEDCLIGLLFEDTNDATHFYKRVTTRQKHGSSATVKNKNAIALKERVEPKNHNTPGPRGEFMDVNTAQRQRRSKGVLYYDDVPPPEWRSLYAELESAGITEDMIVDNRQFIKDYIAQQGGPLVGLEPPVPRKYQRAHEKNEGIYDSPPVESKPSIKHKKAPPPPPPPAASSSQSPAPSQPTNHSYSPSIEEGGSPQPEETTSSPEPAKFKPVFRVPPPIANLPKPPSQQNNEHQPPTRTTSLASNERPLPSTPPQTNQNQSHKFNVPPPLSNMNHQAPPVPPARGNAPPPPPRANGQSSAPSQRVQPIPPTRTGNVPPPAPPPRAARGAAPSPPPSRSHPAPPPRNTQPPQLPPVHHQPQPQQQQYQQPPPPQQYQQPPAPPPLQPRPAASIPQASPAPPSLPQSISSPPPPPPPMPQLSSNNAPPSPGPPPPTSSDNSNNNFTEATGDAGRDALLASIRGAGVTSLKKTDKSQLEKPSVLLQEARGEPNQGTNASSPPPSAGPPGSLADALSLALNKRKAKVSQSDDEDDDW